MLSRGITQSSYSSASVFQTSSPHRSIDPTEWASEAFILCHPLRLLRPLQSHKIRHPVFRVELDIDDVAQMRLPAIESAGLDHGLVGHEFQLGVQAGAAGAAEGVSVGFAAIADDVVGFGGACLFSG